MSAWPAVVAEVAVALLLVAGMRRAFRGAPPDRGDPVAAAAWMLAGALLTTTALLAGGDRPWRLALTAAAVACGCAAGWWLRGPAGEEDDGPPERPAPGEPPPAPDWDAFDRLREDWRARPRSRTPVS